MFVLEGSQGRSELQGDVYSMERTRIDVVSTTHVAYWQTVLFLKLKEDLACHQGEEILGNITIKARDEKLEINLAVELKVRNI